jgi:hypothetical protein
MTIYDYGVDLDSSLTFQDGDLKLKEYTNNIGQAIANRLNTFQDSLDLFYYDYGSFFTSYFGWRRRQSTLDLMKVELDLTLREDPRVNDFETELEFGETVNSVVIKIRLYDNGVETDLNYVLTDEGVELVEEE